MPHLKGCRSKKKKITIKYAGHDPGKEMFVPDPVALHAGRSAS